jgi:uncharacterized membrane-anchored protein
MRALIAVVVSLLSAAGASGQSNAQTAIDWQRGPIAAKLGSQAQLAVPQGYLFADSEGARKFLEMNENISSGQELGLLASPKSGWFVIFEFSDVGYVKDDEKKSLDADAMLDSIRKATEAANEERRRRGWGAMTVVGWMRTPHYDEVTHNLEWAVKGEDEKGNVNSNLNTRYLGRRGYMSVTLVADADKFETTTTEFRKVLNGFSYAPDNDYRAFVKGDKVAEYGLTALVVGGAAAVAAKTGLLKIIGKFLLAGWKLILAGLAALAGLLRKLFARRDREAPVGTTSTDGQ